ncbi:DUF5325 family protein [Bacillus suaedaesalsae]|uniref:DUF5325 family protein n=1 Tax=Bacillus suaedaesalsae TaxID=2810349 RepID=A0ABS2DJF5_9BACI|nr:DUF5325 family protein [Bacillus suaedaesalsae]MBM6618608.1 DUF5325 family protein [Bacillus suaedaesalsae]
MQKKKVISLLLAFLTAFFIILIGIAIAERSGLGILGAILGVIVTMGVGFVFKAKNREKE